MCLCCAFTLVWWFPPPIISMERIKSRSGEDHTIFLLRLWRNRRNIIPQMIGDMLTSSTKSDNNRQGAFLPLLLSRPEEVPDTECLKDTVERFVPYWKDVICQDVRQREEETILYYSTILFKWLILGKQQVKAGKRVIVAAHGNSLRALVKYLDNVRCKKLFLLEREDALRWRVTVSISVVSVVFTGSRFRNSWTEYSDGNSACLWAGTSFVHFHLANSLVWVRVFYFALFFLLFHWLSASLLCWNRLKLLQ